MAADPTTIFEQKRRLRAEVLAKRKAQPEKDAISRRIIERLFSLPVYQSAKTVLLYADVRSEVRTRWVFPEVLETGKDLIVPYCVGPELELFRLMDPAELVPGRFGIPEPEPALRDSADRKVAPEQLELLIVPGLAFDHGCERLGHGFGFYDRLLRNTRPGVLKIGIAFECQIVPQVPTEPHDVPLDAVVTEKATYRSGISRW